MREELPDGTPYDIRLVGLVPHGFEILGEHELALKAVADEFNACDWVTVTDCDLIDEDDFSVAQMRKFLIWETDAISIDSGEQGPADELP